MRRRVPGSWRARAAVVLRALAFLRGPASFLHGRAFLRVGPLQRGPAASLLRREPGTARCDPPRRAAGSRRDTSAWDVSARPRQGGLDDCWLLAPMLAIHETAPELLPRLLEGHADGTVTMRFPGRERSMRVDREMPVGRDGRWFAATESGGRPGWPGAMERAVASQVAGGYPLIQRGFARTGFSLLLGDPSRTHLRFPEIPVIADWLAQGRAICASTHPLSSRVSTAAGPLPVNHVFALVGADPVAGTISLRNPVRPERELALDAGTLRRGFLALDVSRPLR